MIPLQLYIAASAPLRKGLLHCMAMLDKLHKLYVNQQEKYSLLQFNKCQKYDASISHPSTHSFPYTVLISLKFEVPSITNRNGEKLLSTECVTEVVSLVKG